MCGRKGGVESRAERSSAEGGRGGCHHPIPCLVLQFLESDLDVQAAARRSVVNQRGGRQEEEVHQGRHRSFCIQVNGVLVFFLSPVFLVFWFSVLGLAGVEGNVGVMMDTAMRSVDLDGVADR